MKRLSPLPLLAALPLLTAGIVTATVACSEPARTAGSSNSGAAAAGNDANAANDTAAGEKSAGTLTGASVPEGVHAYRSDDGLVRLSYSAPLKPGKDFGGRSLVSAGWRLMWDGSDAGPGTGVVSFSEDAKPRTGLGVVSEVLRIGMSRDAGVVAHCGTAGLQGPNAQRKPNRMLGGHRWTVWHNSDAGMSQQIAAEDLRTVVDGVCYAVDRFSYTVSAADAKPGLPPQTQVAARVDAVVASLIVGGRR